MKIKKYLMFMVVLGFVIFGTSQVFALTLTTGAIAKPVADSSFCTSTTTPWVKITSPNGGENFTVGGPITVTWKSCNVSSIIGLRLMQGNNGGGGFSQTAILLENTLNDGFEIVKIPSNIISNSNYVLTISGITTVNNFQAADQSDNTFTINSTTTPITTLTTNTAVNTTAIKTVVLPTVSATPTPATPALINASQNATFNRTLKVGVVGEDVIRLQKSLIQKGFLTGTADGKFGKGTAAAVAKFQLANNLTADGIAGTKTLILFSGDSIPKPNINSSLCTSTTAPSIKVLSPNGGETYTAGGQITVKWSSCNIPANSSIRIDLTEYSAAEPENFSIGLTQTLNDGTEIVTLPTSNSWSQMFFGNRFKISVWQANYSGLTAPIDYSDNLFTITGTANPIPTTVFPVVNNLGANGKVFTDSNGKKYGYFEQLFQIGNNSSSNVYFYPECAIVPSSSSNFGFVALIKKSNGTNVQPLASNCAVTWLGSGDINGSFVEPGASHMGAVIGVFELPTNTTGSYKVILNRFGFRESLSSTVPTIMDLSSQGSGFGVNGVVPVINF